MRFEGKNALVTVDAGEREELRLVDDPNCSGDARWILEARLVRELLALERSRQDHKCKFSILEQEPLL